MRRFTLIELLVVIAIIAILASMLLPALNKSRERAKTADCLSRKKEVMLAQQLYASDNGDFMILGATLSPYQGDGTAAMMLSGTKHWGAPGSPNGAPRYTAYANFTCTALNIPKIYDCNFLVPGSTNSNAHLAQVIGWLQVDGMLNWDYAPPGVNKNFCVRDPNATSIYGGHGYYFLPKFNKSPAGIIACGDSAHKQQTITPWFWIRYSGGDANTATLRNAHGNNTTVGFFDGHARSANAADLNDLTIPVRRWFTSEGVNQQRY